MVETLVFGATVALCLLLLDLVLRRLAGRPDGAAPADRLLVGARVMALFLLAASLTSRCRGDGSDFAGDVLWTALFGGAGLVLLELALLLGLAPLGGVVAAARSGNLAAATAVAARAKDISRVGRRRMRRLRESRWEADCRTRRPSQRVEAAPTWG